MVRDYANEIILLASTLAALFAIWKIVIPVFLFLKNWIMDLREQSKLVREMAAEFKPNGGGSLRDSVNRIEARVDRIEDMNERTNAKQWALVATQKDPVFENNAAGECVRANTMTMNLMERSIEELLGYGWENCLHPEDHDRVVDEWREAVGKRRSFESTFKVISAVSKRVYKVHCVANPYFTTAGDILGYIGRYVTINELTIP